MRGWPCRWSVRNTSRPQDGSRQDKDTLDLETLFRLGVLDMGKTRSIIKQYLGEYAAANGIP